MRFEIPENLIPKLRELQSRQMVHPDEVLKTEDAVELYASIGPTLYLTFDGRVIVHAFLDDEPPCESSDPKDFYQMVVLGARAYLMPELLSLLPQRPPDSTDCSNCKGSGWWLFMKDTKGKPIELACWECGGVGWIARS